MAKFKDNLTPYMFPEAKPVFPVRRKSVFPKSVDLRGFIKRLVSQILKESPDSREIIAAKMAEAMNCSSFSKAMLDMYSSEANENHQISLFRFIVLVQVTEAFWVWDELLKNDGLTVLYEEEARLARLGALKQKEKEIQREINTLLKMDPVKIRRRK